MEQLSFYDVVLALLLSIILTLMTLKYLEGESESDGSADGSFPCSFDELSLSDVGEPVTPRMKECSHDVKTCELEAHCCNPYSSFCKAIYASCTTEEGYASENVFANTSSKQEGNSTGIKDDHFCISAVKIGSISVIIILVVRSLLQVYFNLTYKPSSSDDPLREAEKQKQVEADDEIDPTGSQHHEYSLISVKSIQNFKPKSLGANERHIFALSLEKLEANKSDDSSFLDAFNKPLFHHMFEFRPHVIAPVTATVCPATVSLASHFASGTYGNAGSGVKELHKEGVRLASFKDFPTTVPVSAMRMAQAGFHYTGTRDKVECFLCKATYQGWKIGDKPAAVHASISPQCPLVVGSETTNLPLPLPVTSAPDFSQPASVESGYGSGSFSGPPSVDTVRGSAQGDLQSDSAPDAMQDSLGMGSSGPAAISHPSRPTISVPSSLVTSENSLFSGAPLTSPTTAAEGGASRNNQPMPHKRLDLGGAVYPLYSQMDARKRSFATWTQGQHLPPVDELVTLGFFYAGYADCVRCFFCGIGLKSWEPGDIPAEVHGRWRPTCEYLRLVKGDHFVDQVANGGRNISDVAAPQQHHSSGDAVQPSLNLGTRGDALLSASQAGTATTGSNSEVTVQVPDVPVVRRARETGYTDQQISEGIQKLRLIGMERAMDVMLVEVLTNLFRDHPPPSGNSGNNPTNNAAAGNQVNDNAAAQPDVMGRDIEPDAERAGNAAEPAADDDPELRERQNDLQQENARLRNMRTCQRCQTRPVGVIFLPCGHILACTTCAPTIRRCLRCDTVIKATANVYFS